MKFVDTLAAICINRCYFYNVEPRDCIVSYQFHGFSDASEKAYGCCIYLKCITKNNFISSSLVASKSKVTPIKSKLSTPRSESLSNLILSRLILTMLNPFQGETIISRLHAWTDSIVSLTWIKALNKEFQTFVQNQVVEIRKNISPENWSYWSTKVKPSDLIIRLDKNIDFTHVYLIKIIISKAVIFLRGNRAGEMDLKVGGPWKKFSNSTRSRMVKTTIFWPWWQPFNSFCFETLSFFPFLVADGPGQLSGYHTVDNTIDIKSYSDLIKLFRVTALVTRFVKNVFRKIKGDNLNSNSYIDVKEIYEAKVHWIKAYQLRLLKSDSYEHL